MRGTGIKTKPTSYHVVIIELDSSLARRDTTKPHLYIKVSSSSPEYRLLQLMNGVEGEFAIGHYVAIYAKEPYANAAKNLKVANLRKRELVEKYSRLGHAINGDLRTWSVYVINLKQDHLKTKPRLGHVYVGYTSKAVESRIKEHQCPNGSGKKLNSIYVTKHFDSQNKSLTMERQFFTKKSAEEKEESYAEELCRKGYLVCAGHVTPDPKTCKSKIEKQEEEKWMN